MIRGVSIYPREKFCTDQGCVYKWAQPQDPFFEKFGEVYFSSIVPGIIKGWNIHTISDMNLVCISGSVRFVLYDRRSDSPTKGTIQEFTIGRDSYDLVHIPHGVAFSWKALGSDEALIGNLATQAYAQGELIKIDPKSGEIPYQWQ